MEDFTAAKFQCLLPSPDGMDKCCKRMIMNDWVKKCMEYEVVGCRPRGRPKRTWLEVVQRDCQVRGLSEDDAKVRSSS